ncbi:MAG: D-alanyl-D-alanine endopeptidase precursor [Candidatus Accumulibacter adjunctus]|uniref:D-alanyl-D-alanine endopeptidase n=1 Tax=Candidatus Accumulibacter adjunctus TaxID=1454001 RepID=A0A011NUT8_9PROT|nr:MAG: D-alanyl-D-alanine endopeptidase precursor [Candidatus Accumulibacter adjunctus]
MRMTLRALTGLCLVLLTPLVASTGTLYAAEQGTGKTKSAANKTKEKVAAKANTSKTVAQKNPPATDKRKEKVAAKANTSQTVAQKNPPATGQNRAAKRDTRPTAVAEQRKVGLAADRESRNKEATQLSGRGKGSLRQNSGKPSALAAKSALPPPRETAPAAQAYQKRNLTRALASNADLWHEPGQLAVHSGSALVVGQDAGELLYEKNANAVVPIASITKVMTAMVVLDSMPNLQAPINISDEDVDYLRGSRSRLGVGTVITRETALLLALMSSENRASHALARHYPGGLQAFVAAMNRKAASLGMVHTRFEDPTGLSSNNVSTAHDLARMVAAAHRYPLIREFSTTPGVRAEVKGRELDFHNTNQLVSSPTWEIGLSKTGYIQEAGKCLVMQARVADKPVVIVLLDSAGKQTRIGDANRIKRWMESASAAGRLPTPV